MLRGRLIVDDPDGFEESYPARQRGHGTSMASVMVNGDLSRPTSLTRPIYVRPILRPHEWVERREEVPEDTLIVDLLYRAVRRMKEGDGKEPATAPNVCIVNLSIGIPGRPFHTAMSPLARLIDWLAWRYRILFLVSAGNYAIPIRLEVPKAAFLDLPPVQRQELMLQAVFEDGRLRRLLSPAEAMNALTVGAMHDDFSESAPPAGHIDPIGPSFLPSPVNALGLGYRRSIKPDLLATGGRVPVEAKEQADGSIFLSPYTDTLPPGVKTAAPSSRLGDVAGVVHGCGSSIGCAYTSHWATHLYGILDELRDTHGAEIDRVPRALWLKALLVHATEWQRGFEVLSPWLERDHDSHKRREIGSRFLGYGGFDPARATACAYHRATALSAGIIQADEKRTHRFPLPPSLAGKRQWKRLVITLAWLSPINPSHQKWRRADLWFEAKPGDTLKVGRNGSDHHAVRRGTVQHEIYDGPEAAVFVDGDAVAINVNCKAGAGDLKDAIPYSLAVTLEVGEGTDIPIYEEVRARIRQRVRIQPST